MHSRIKYFELNLHIVGDKFLENKLKLFFFWLISYYIVDMFPKSIYEIIFF